MKLVSAADLRKKFASLFGSEPNGGVVHARMLMHKLEEAFPALRDKMDVVFYTPEAEGKAGKIESIYIDIYNPILAYLRTTNIQFGDTLRLRKAIKKKGKGYVIEPGPHMIAEPEYQDMIEWCEDFRQPALDYFFGWSQKEYLAFPTRFSELMPYFSGIERSEGASPTTRNRTHHIYEKKVDGKKLRAHVSKRAFKTYGLTHQDVWKALGPSGLKYFLGLLAVMDDLPDKLRFSISWKGFAKIVEGSRKTKVTDAGRNTIRCLCALKFEQLSNPSIFGSYKESDSGFGFEYIATRQPPSHLKNIRVPREFAKLGARRFSLAIYIAVFLCLKTESLVEDMTIYDLCHRTRVVGQEKLNHKDIHERIYKALHKIGRYPGLFELSPDELSGRNHRDVKIKLKYNPAYLQKPAKTHWLIGEPLGGRLQAKTLRELYRALHKQTGLTKAEFARSLGREKQYITDLLNHRVLSDQSDTISKHLTEKVYEVYTSEMSGL